MIYIKIDLPFSETEDNIIKTMKNQEQYQELVQKRGKDQVDEREHFLNSDK
jgi:hypothetical protein